MGKKEDPTEPGAPTGRSEPADSADRTGQRIRTKLVVTLGPATSDSATVGALIRAGMNVGRLNFSHGSHSEHRDRAALVRAAANRVGRHVAVLQDLQGPRLRVGSIAPGTYLEAGSTVTLDGARATGTAERIPMSFAREVAASVSEGQSILLADGTLELTVSSVRESEIEAQVVTGGPLSSRKGVNLPGCPVKLPAITKKDLADLAFGIDLEVDYVALSFVGGGEDLERLRRHIRRRGADIPLVAKIERQAAIDNIEEIIAASDAVMVARGDLALEIGAAAVPLFQKKIIRMANRVGVPVITATQMLDSMIRNPVPTRAETSDVANAILDGTDALMLSGETAIGRYPLEAVLEMRSIAIETEPALAYARIGRRGNEAERRPSTTEAMSQAAVELARRLRVDGIIAATSSGWTARAVAKNRPEMLLVGAAQDQAVCRRLALVWGVTPVHVGRYADTDQMVEVVASSVEAQGLLGAGDEFVLISGQPLGRAGSTNMIQVRHVGDWLDADISTWPNQEPR